MKKLFLLFASLVLVFFSTSCSTKNKEEKVLKMGFVPSSNSEQLVEDVKPIAEALSKKLGIRVEAFTASSYIGVIEGIGSGSVDFGIIPPFSSVLAQKQSEAIPLLTAKGRNGKPGYYPVLYVRKNSNIKSLSDVKGKKVAFVDPASSSGYIYPGVMLKKSGIDLDKDITYQFSGGHDKSLQLLLSEDVDLIGSYAGVIQKYEKEFPGAEDKLEKLATGDLIPGQIITVFNGMDKELQEKLKKALIEIQKEDESKEVFKKLFGITGFEDVDIESYKNIEKNASLMNVDLNKVK